jgi:glycosyltransferase involved in cell wall biosynthesis
MNFNPMVSIIIPVFNGANFLAEAIESALAQTYANIEILVINDGSSDGGLTQRVAARYEGRIRYVEKGNGGVSSALNRGIEMMRGDYFSWLSHDDLYAPDKVQSQVDALRGLADRNNFIVYSDYANQYALTGKVKPVRVPVNHAGSFRYHLAVGNDVQGCTLLIPRSAFDRCGLFNEDLRALQDYEMWFRMSETYRFAHVRRQLVINRVHKDQVGSRLRGRALAEGNRFRISCLDALTEAELSEATGDEPALAYAEIAGVFWQRGLRQASHHALTKSVHALPRASAKSLVTWPLKLAEMVTRSAVLACYMGVKKLAARYARKSAASVDLIA